MKRIVDLFIAVSLLIVMSVPVLVIALLVKLTSKGPILYFSNRVGKNNIVFKMPKFRTMKVGTPVVASNLLSEPNRFLTLPGKFLRYSSLDELPQLWCIIRGDMTLVGPRPALFNQDDLIALRTAEGVHCLVPGLTGWAQVNGRDEMSIFRKVELDAEYLHSHSLRMDFYIIWLTVFKVVTKDGVSS
jgi:O-antigen biosynthesis protein WbqP